ncbi:hypothetical protein G9A89_002542 [Geosiphon pyriformis]|nr:hypothetical protein G9A89_002542 [Geosiphon pyriformis]
MAAAKLANDYSVVVNTNLKHPNNNHMNQAIVLKEIPVRTSVETVCMTVSEFGVIKIIKMQLVALCAVCKGFGHISLSCQSVKNAVAPGGRKAPLSAQDQFRLARIYAKKSAPISCSLAFGSKTWALVVSAPPVHTSHDAGMSLGFNKISEPLSLVVDNLESCLVGIENSLVSLIEQISELAKRLESLMLANQGEDIVMGMGLSEATSDKIVLIVDLTASFYVVKLEKMLDGLFRSVLSLSACFNSLALADGATFLTSSQ